MRIVIFEQPQPLPYIDNLYIIYGITSYDNQCSAYTVCGSVSYEIVHARAMLITDYSVRIPIITRRSWNHSYEIGPLTISRAKGAQSAHFRLKPRAVTGLSRKILSAWKFLS